MPRIPSAADVNPVGAAASRLPTVRADAADFGLAIAQGLASFGEGVGDVGKRLVYEAQLKEAEDKTEAAKQEADKAAHQAAVREAAIQMVDAWEYDGSAPREAATKAAKALEAVEDKRLKGLPQERRAALKAASAPIRQGQALRIAQRTQNLSVAALDRQTAETLQLLQKQAVREPQAAAHYAVEGRAALQSLRDAGALTPEQYAAQEEVFRRSLYTAAVRGQPAVEAMAALEDGIYDDALSDPELKRFLMQETGWRLQSETAQGAAGAEAQLTRARRGESVPPVLSAGTQRILAAGGMADAALRIERANRVRSEMQSLRYAPEAEVAERIDALAPAADAPDAETRREIQQEVWIQSQAMLRARRTDPAAFAMEQPAVAEAFATAEKNPALLPDAVSARLAAQEVMGLVPEEQNALTKEECSQIVAGLKQLEPQQRIAALMELGKAYGDQSGVVAADLAEAGLSFGEMLAADPATDPEISGRFAQVVENQGAAKPAEVGMIEEAAERLLAEGQAAALRAEQLGQGAARGVRTGNTPPLPKRKPGAALPSAVPPATSASAGSERVGSETVLRGRNEAEILEKYRDLMVGEYASELNARLRSPAVKDYVLELERQADDANASSAMRKLFPRLMLHKLLKEGLSAEQARRLAAAETGIGVLQVAPIGETERQVRDLLTVMLIRHDQPIYDPDRILSFIKEIMAIRQVDEAGRAAAWKELFGRLQSLEKTKDKFLFPHLRDALNRAVMKPEISAWALTDAELAGVYQATGDSSDLLNDVGIVTAPVLPVSLAAALAGRQQSTMRSAYERELRRRGYLKLPADH